MKSLVPGIKGCFTIRKFSNIIFHSDRLEEKNDVYLQD